MSAATRIHYRAQLRAFAGVFILLFSFIFNASPLFAVSGSWQQGILGIEFFAGICASGSVSADKDDDGKDSSKPADSDGWTFPTVAGTPISSDYKSAERPGHRGVDLANSDGTPIYAARDGTVVAAGPASGFGNWIIIQHEEDGKRVDSVYGHMWDSGVGVSVGQKVSAGDQIGTIGNNGESYGAHLHYEEWNGGRFSGGERKPVAVYGGSAEEAPTDPEDEKASDTPQPSSSNSSCCSSNKGGTPSAPLAGGDNVEKVWNYLKEQGLTDEQAAGVMGNLAWESGDPTFQKATASIEQGSGAGFGLMQWTGVRRNEITAAAQREGKDLTDLQFQLDYMVNESKGRSAKNGNNEWEELTKQKTLEEATYYFMDNAERPGIPHYEDRLRYAKMYLDKYGGKSGSGSSPSNSTQCTPTDKRV